LLKKINLNVSREQNQPRQRFAKSERLKNRKVIGRLFQRQGATAAAFPLRLMWMPVAEPRGETTVQFTLSVPKRSFRRAVDRNLLRRRVREAYRIEKGRIAATTDSIDGQYALIALYTGREILSYAVIQRSMRRLLRKFADDVRKQSA
jgi:ribonuclease P protein component